MTQVHYDLAQLPDFQRTILTVGSFDGVHEGHLHILRQLNEHARLLNSESVVVTFDPHPRAFLQPEDTDFRLISATEEKVKWMAKAGIEHIVVAPFDDNFSRLSAGEYVESFLVRLFHPAMIIIGYDHRFGNDRQGDINFLRNCSAIYGFEVVEIPAHQIDDLAVSSSKIRRALAVGDIRKAHKMLGHPFSFAGRVIEGDRLGRTIGFPTANLTPVNPLQLIPAEGIYAVRVELPDQSLHNGMLYIGRRPSLEGASELRIEVNLLHFEGDLYGQILHIEMVDFIRPDKKLTDLQALTAQIETDRKTIVARLNALNQESI